MHLNIHIHLDIRIYIYTFRDMPKHSFAYMHSDIQMRLDTCIHAYIDSDKDNLDTHKCIYTCMHTCIHPSIHTHILIHPWIHTHTHTYTHANTHTHMQKKNGLITPDAKYMNQCKIWIRPFQQVWSRSWACYNLLLGTCW